MAEPDFYAVLGVPRDAGQDEINSAYRRLVRQHHPDVATAPGSPAELERIMAAYAVLRDPGRRAEYDRRHARQQPQPEPTPATPRRRARTNVTIRVSPVRFHDR